jgi:dTDP-4-dehydrorhamnose reductase
MVAHKLLVVGGDSYLGARLIRVALSGGMDVVATSRRPVTGARRHVVPTIELDLAADPSVPPALLAATTQSVVLAGLTGIGACESDPALSWSLNVEATAAVVSQLASAGVRTLVASSSQVFSRFAKLPGVNLEPSPTCVYGHHKVALEERALKSSLVTVVRFTKIVGPDLPLLVSWQRRLHADKSIEAFTNMRIAPVDRDRAATCLLSILQSDPIVPIVHVSSVDDISYFELACSLADRLGKRGLVSPIESENDPLRGLIPGPHAALGEPFTFNGAPTPAARPELRGLPILPW